MRILVLGGTSFVGRAIVTDALRAGAEVTLFGRGKTGPDLFPGLVRLIGDRDTGDYAALAGGHWDAVADVSGYVPRHVGQAMDAVGDRAGRYLFISSHAVYQQAGVGAGSTEDTHRLTPVWHTEEIGADTYGPLKVACEDDVRVAGTDVEIVRVPSEGAPPLFPLVRTDWASQQRSPARARAAGLPATPLEATVADVLAWDRERGEPPLARGFSPEQEQALVND
jgi:uncharacterized protein YbjT (DUF2867 family)